LVSQDEATEIAFLFISFLLIGASILASIFRVIREFKVKWVKSDPNRAKDAKGDEKLNKMIDNSNDRDYLSEQEKCMSKMDRQQMIRFNDLDATMFIPREKRS
jgi:hypothetical protein